MQKAKAHHYRKTYVRPMDIQHWVSGVNAMAIVLAFYVLSVGFYKVPNEMHKWHTVSLMTASLATNIFVIAWRNLEGCGNSFPPSTRLVFFFGSFKMTAYLSQRGGGEYWWLQYPECDDGQQFLYQSRPSRSGFSRSFWKLIGENFIFL